MDFYTMLRSMSGRTILFAALGVAYYVALNALLIREIIGQVQAPQVAVATRAHARAATPAQDPSASCAELAKADREVCQVDLLVGKASARLKERRAAREERRATRVPAALTDQVYGQSAAAVVMDHR